MKTKDLIRKVIMGAAVVLTMLPVQARADSCSHTLEYTAEGNALVETCTQECGYEEKAWLAMDSEAPLVYNGGEMKPLKVEYTEGWQGGELTIVYDNNVEASTEDVKASGSISMEIAGPEDEKEIITAVETFAIARAAMNVTAVPYTAVYDGQPHGITLEGLPANAAVTYCATEDGEYSDVPMTQKDVGSITVWYKVAADNYQDISGSATVEIIPRELTVTAEAEMTYGEEVPEIQPSYEGFAAGEDVSVLTGVPVLSHGYAQFMDAGSYKIQVSAAGISAGNYTVTEKNGALTVKPRELAVVWDATTFTYDSEVHKPTATVSGMVNGDEIQCTAEGEGAEAGTYPAKITITGEKSGNYCLPDNGEIQFVIEKAPQTAPENLTTVQESILNIGDGQITGVTAEMEYKRKGAEDQYTPVPGTEITGLASGTYLVRYAEKANHAASPDAEVTVTAEKVLTVSLPKNQVGYTLTANPEQVGWKGESKLTFQLLSGYSKVEEAFAIKVGDEPITLESDNTYIIKDIRENKVITVEGVVDQTPPEAVITVTGKNTEEVVRTSSALVETVKFEDFFKQIKVVITGADASGIKSIVYYESDTKVEDVTTVTKWETYPESGIAVSRTDGNLIFYAKVTDNSGNVTYVSSNGMVFDTKAPRISILAGTYYTTQTSTVTDSNLNTAILLVKNPRLGTEEKREIESSVTMTGNIDMIYKITATDKAGHTISKQVTMKPIDTLDDSIESLTTDNMKPDNKAAVNTVLNKVKDLLKKEPSAEEKKLLEDIQNNCEELLKNVHYSITSKAADLRWAKSSGKKLVIETDAGSSELDKLWIGGKEITKSEKNYKYENGTLTIMAACLEEKTVTVGKKTIKLEFEDGETDGEDKIEILKAGTNPKTGDNSHLTIWCLTAGLSAAGLVAATWADRKRRYQV